MEATRYELSPAEKARRESALEEARRQNALIAEAARRAKETELARTAIVGVGGEVAAEPVPLAEGETAPSATALGGTEAPALLQAANMTANVSPDQPLRFAR